MKLNKTVRQFIYFVLVILIIVWIIDKSSLGRMTGLPESTESYDELRVVDSVKANSKKIYWFCYDLGALGYTSGKLSYCENAREITNKNTFMISSYITGMEFHEEKNELVVFVFDNQFENEDDSRIWEEKKPDFEIRLVKGGDPQKSIENRLEESRNLRKDSR
jgi:hypothetical protein